MRCPECQHDMIHSPKGWLCFNCGHLEGDGATKSVPKIKLKAKSKPIPTKPDETPPPPPTPIHPPVVSASPPTPPVEKPAAVVLPPASPSPTSTTKRPTSRRSKIALIGLLVILFILAAIYFGYVRPAQAAGRRFQTRLAKSNSANLDSRITFKGDDFLSSFKTDVQISGGYSKADNQFKTDLRFTGPVFGQPYSGQIITDHGDLYLRLSGAHQPVIRYRQSASIYQLTSDWHKTKIDKTLFDNYCETRPDSRYPQPLLLYRLFKSIKPQTSLIANPWSRLAGSRATHFHGQLPAIQLADSVQRLNSELPEGCGIGFPIEDLKKLKIRYDLWTGDITDRLKISLTDPELGANLIIQIDLKNYNGPVIITPPANPIDLATARQNQQGQLDRDQQRKSHLDSLKVALTAYAKANSNRFPAALASLSPRYLAGIPTDPKTHQAYSYSVPSGRRSYTLTANLESGTAYTLTGP